MYEMYKDEDQLYLCSTHCGKLCVLGGKRPPLLSGFKITGMQEYEDEVKEQASQILKVNREEIQVQAVNVPFTINVEFVG